MKNNSLNSLFMQGLCLAHDAGIFRPGMKGHSPSPCILSSDSSVFNSGAALVDSSQGSVLKLSWYVVMLVWLAYIWVCLLWFSLHWKWEAVLGEDGCLHSLWCASFTSLCTDDMVTLANPTSPPAAQQFKHIANCHILPWTSSSFGFCNYQWSSQQTWAADKWKSWVSK